MTVVAQPRGEPATRTDVTTTTDGAWRLVVRPQIFTSYTPEWRTAKIAGVSLNVRPRVSLRKVAARKFSTSVIATASHAGKLADFKRWSPTLRRWLLVKRVKLRQSTVDDNIAVASFRVKVRKGRKLRMFLRQSQVLPGYVAGYSNFIVN